MEKLKFYEMRSVAKGRNEKCISIVYTNINSLSKDNWVYKEECRHPNSDNFKFAFLSRTESAQCD